MSSKRIVLRHLSAFWSEERNLSVLLGIIIFYFFILPSLTSVFGERLAINLLTNLTYSLLFLAGVFELTRHKVIQTVFAVIVALIIFVRWARLISGGTWLAGWDIFLSLVSSLAFAVVVLGHVYKEGPVTGHRIQGAVAAYLLLAMAFSLAYFLIEFIAPGSFQIQDRPMMQIDSQSWKVFHYFSISTITTVGYGDITAIHPIARNLAMAEALVGQLFPAILIARLVSLHVQKHRAKKEE
ncbi:MAG: two pore domain potassium channel family protein [Nitrospirae bacterium]|nr:two pore domain potassium channel family protein [Nitrospirota bacterium]